MAVNRVDIWSLSDVNDTLNSTLTTEGATRTADASGLATETIITLTFEAILTVIILIENGLVLFAFCSNRKLHRNIANYYLMQLALSDFLTGLFTVLHITVQLHPALLHNQYACFARFSTMMLACAMSLFSLLLITFDRFVAIVRPFYYHSHASKQRVLVKFVIIDAIPLVVFVIIPVLWTNDLVPNKKCLMVNVFPWAFLAFILIPLYLLLTAVKFIMYLIIFYHIHKRYDRAKEMCETTSTKSQVQLQQISKSNMALTKTGAIVLVIFILCWLPFFIPLMMQVYAGVTFEFADVISLTTFILILLSSALNPIVYIWRLPFFRREVKKVFCAETSDGANTGSFGNNRSFNSSQVSARGFTHFIKAQSLIHRARCANGLHDNRRISGETLISARRRSDNCLDSDTIFYGSYKFNSETKYDKIIRSKSCPPMSTICMISDRVDTLYDHSYLPISTGKILSDK